MKRILVVEDDPDIQELLRTFLEDAGYRVEVASDGVEAISLFSKSEYDLILLDIMLPKIDGYGVCELIRRESEVPIVMLTALDAESDQIKGFDLMADDYITKPFSLPVLMRKVDAILRRSSRNAEQKKLIYEDIVLDLEAYKAYVKAFQVDLTQREFELLRELISNVGKVLTRQMLLNSLWKYDFLGDERVVDTHIKNLRKKLGVNCIETIRGVGYRIDRPN